MTANPAARPAPPAAYRWTVLVIISLAMFGNYYEYDSIAPVADLLSKQLGFTDANIGLLYTIYSIAAFIVLIIGGIIIDRIGTARSTTIFGAICVVAGILTCLSPDLTMMAIGRFVLGIGAEPLIVAVTTALAKWFKGKELSLAFGLNLTIARLGSWAADNSPTWAKPAYESGWQEPLILAAWIGSLCVIGAVVYWILEARASRHYQIGEAGTTEKFVLADLYRFTRSYWYIVGLCVVFYSVVFPFRAFAIKFFIEAHGTTREAGGFLNSMLPLSAMIATPLFGLLVDRVGKRALFMAVGSLVLLPLFPIVAYAPAGPSINFDVPAVSIGGISLLAQASFVMPLMLLLVMVVLGMVFSLIPAVMWPSVAYIVEERRLGSGYSLMTFCQQLGMAAVPWIIGKTNDLNQASAQNPAGYTPGLWIFTGLAAIGLVFSYLLWREEHGPHAHGLETITAKG